MTNNELRALALFHQLAALSPDDGDTDLRITIRLADGRFMGDVKLSRRDVEAATDALASVNAYANAERDDLAEMAAVGSLMAAADEPQELHPEALADLEAHFAAIDLGDTDGGA